jgi:GTPase SAR1 family protein
MLSTNFAFLAEKHPEWNKCAEQAEECLWDDPQTTGFKTRYLLEEILNSVYANVGLSSASIDSNEGKIAYLNNMEVLPAKVASAFHVVRDIGNAAVHADKKRGPCTTPMARQGLEHLHTAAVWYYETYVDGDFSLPEFQPYVYTCASTGIPSEKPTEKKRQDIRTSTDMPSNRVQEPITSPVLLEHEQEEPTTDAKPIVPPVTYVDLEEDSAPDSQDAEVKPGRNDLPFAARHSELNAAAIDIHRILADARQMVIQEHRSTEAIDGVSNEFDSAVAIGREPYRLAVLGAFKAGKSTLINALAGSEIAFTDALCATCIPTGYIYASHPNATIEFHGEQIASMSVEEFLALVQEKRDDAEWVNSVKCATVGYPSDFLKDIEPWDVPGIGGNETDERKALEFMDRVGGAVWVFDSTALGDDAIGEPIQILKMKGVRMVAALNRIDLVDDSDIAAVVDSIDQDFPETFIAVCPVSAITPGLKDGAYLLALVRTIQAALIDSSEADRQKRADLAVAGAAQKIEQVLEKERSLHWAFMGFVHHIRKNLDEQRSLLLSKVPIWVSEELLKALEPIENKAIGILAGGYDSKSDAYKALQQPEELKDAWETAYRAVGQKALEEWETHWFSAISLSIDSVPSAEFTIPTLESTHESKAAEQKAIMAGVADGGKAAAVAAVIAAALYIIHWPVIFVGLPIGLLSWWKKRSEPRINFDLKSEATHLREAVKDLHSEFSKSLEAAVQQLIEAQTEKATRATIREFAKENFAGIADDLIKRNEAKYQSHVNALKAARIEIRRQWGLDEPDSGTGRPLIISPDDPGAGKWAPFFNSGHDTLDIILRSYWEPAGVILRHLPPKTRVRILTTCAESAWASASEQLRKQTKDWNGTCEIRVLAKENGDPLPWNSAWLLTKSEALICRESLESMGRDTCIFELYPDGIFAAQSVFAEHWQGKEKNGQQLKFLIVR